MAETFSWPYIQVADEPAAMAVWNTHASLHGAMGMGIYLTRHTSFISGMVNRFRELVPENTVVSNTSRLPHAFFQYPSGAVLRISPVHDLADALSFAGHSFNWMAVDDPAGWPDRGLIDRMLMVLDTQNVETRLVAVKSPFHFASAALDAPAVPLPDDLDALVQPPDPTHIAAPHSDEPSG